MWAGNTRDRSGTRPSGWPPGRGSLGGEDAGRGGPVRPSDADATRCRVARRAAHDRRPLLQVAGQDVQQCRTPASSLHRHANGSVHRRRLSTDLRVCTRWQCAGASCAHRRWRRLVLLHVVGRILVGSAARAHEEPHPSGVPFMARHHLTARGRGPRQRLRGARSHACAAAWPWPSRASSRCDGDCADDDGLNLVWVGARNLGVRGVRPSKPGASVVEASHAPRAKSSPTTRVTCSPCHA